MHITHGVATVASSNMRDSNYFFRFSHVQTQWCFVHSNHRPTLNDFFLVARNIATIH